MRLSLAGAASLVWLIAIGCMEQFSPKPAAATITLATTTSTQDSGLLEMLCPMFRAQTGIDVKVIAVGTGQALELGRRGDADVLLTHARVAEEEFVRQGYGIVRVPVFQNDFVLLGPPDGALSLNPPKSLDDAFGRCAAENLPFVSRDDDSGTHHKEKELWQSISLEPTFANYLRSGSGMARTLRIADERRACTLTDRATWLALSGELHLRVIFEGDPRLKNPYAAIVVKGDGQSPARVRAAHQFIEFLQKETTRQAIQEFGKDQYGEGLFFPDGGAPGAGQKP